MLKPRKVSKLLIEENVATDVACSRESSLFSPPLPGSAKHLPLVDTTFVDDETIIVTASSPKLLDTYLAKTVQTVVRVYADFSMRVNGSKGKMEAMIAYRGTHARACRQKLLDRRDADNNIVIPIDVDGVGVKLSIVNAYKHLGSIVAIDDSYVPEARARATAALASYAPMAMSIFGSKALPKD